MSVRVHICGCGDCAVAPYDDRCRYELRVAELEGEVERLRGERVEHIPDECAGHYRRVLYERDEARAEVARLSRRPDLSPEQAQRVADVCEGAWFVVGRGLREDQAAILAALRAAAEREEA